MRDKAVAATICILTVICLSFFSPLANSRGTWTYQGLYDYYAYRIVATSDGGYAIVGQATVGYRNQVADTDVLLMKVNADGVLQWTQTYGKSLLDYGRSAVLTPDGGFLLIGATNTSTTKNDVWLIKTNSTGNEVWNKTYGFGKYSFGYDLVATHDGGYILAGNALDYGAGHEDMLVIKIDSAGNEQWNRAFGGVGDDYGRRIIGCSDGSYVIVGSIENSEGMALTDTDVFAVKIDLNGNLLWSHKYGCNRNDDGYGVVEASDGGYVLTGLTNINGGGDVWLLKVDYNGNELWNKTYTKASYDEGHSIVATSDGGYTIVGNTYAYPERAYDVWLIKVDSLGNILWNQTFGGAKNEEGQDLAVTTSGGYAVVGYKRAEGTNIDQIWLIITNENGNLQDYTLTTCTVGNGVISHNNQTYAGGSTLQLKATPAAGWSFSGWSGDASGTSDISITMDSDKIVTATFTQNPVVFPTSTSIPTVTVTETPTASPAPSTESPMPTRATSTAQPTIKPSQEPQAAPDSNYVLVIVSSVITVGVIAIVISILRVYSRKK